tara:strand:+ start:3417 stop:3797 length:381 start_codon:yes stop_codon:yes gene_type:complete
MEETIAMTNVKSIKAKGRKLQNIVRDKLRETFIVKNNLYPKLEEDDIKSQTMGMTGEDIVLSPNARLYIPYSFECKNVEKLNVWKSFKQCEDNAKDHTPILVIKKNRENPKVVMDLNDWIKLIEKK